MKHAVTSSPRLLSSSLLVLALAACGDPNDNTNDPADAGTRPAACDQAAYDKANLDAAQTNASEVSTTLFALSPSNPQAQWKDAEKTLVRVAVWTSYTGYTTGNNALTRDLFVTPVPQVKTLCQSVTLTGNERANRLNQYLGLPAEADNKRQIVEMWVKTADMFRPCPDADISDATCDLTYPSTATAAHKTWLNNYYGGSYGPWLTTHYPFTGQGYTYDWCSGTASPQGASEYVVRNGSTVEVIGYSTTDAYCAK